MGLGNHGAMPGGGLEGVSLWVSGSHSDFGDSGSRLSAPGNVDIHFPVQIRLAYTGLLIICQISALGWLYWVPAVGTFALVLFGYCLMARILSLLPGNRTEPMSLDLLRRTFLTPPAPGNIHHGLPANGCAGGACTLEGRIASLSARTRNCMIVGYAAVCASEGIELDDLRIETEGDIDLRGFLGIDSSVKPGYDSLRYTVHIRGHATAEQLERVHEIVKATSPNRFNVAAAIALKSRLVVES